MWPLLIILIIAIGCILVISIFKSYRYLLFLIPVAAAFFISLYIMNSIESGVTISNLLPDMIIGFAICFISIGLVFVLSFIVQNYHGGRKKKNEESAAAESSGGRKTEYRPRAERLENNGGARSYAAKAYRTADPSVPVYTESRGRERAVTEREIYSADAGELDMYPVSDVPVSYGESEADTRDEEYAEEFNDDSDAVFAPAYNSASAESLKNAYDAEQEDISGEYGYQTAADEDIDGYSEVEVYDAVAEDADHADADGSVTEEEYVPIFAGSDKEPDIDVAPAYGAAAVDAERVTPEEDIYEPAAGEVMAEEEEYIAEEYVPVSADGEEREPVYDAEDSEEDEADIVYDGAVPAEDIVEEEYGLVSDEVEEEADIEDISAYGSAADTGEARYEENTYDADTEEAMAEEDDTGYMPVSAGDGEYEIVYDAATEDTAEDAVYSEAAEIPDDAADEEYEPVLEEAEDEAAIGGALAYAAAADTSAAEKIYESAAEEIMADEEETEEDIAEEYMSVSVENDAVYGSVYETAAGAAEEPGEEYTADEPEDAAGHEIAVDKAADEAAPDTAADEISEADADIAAHAEAEEQTDTSPAEESDVDDVSDEDMLLITKARALAAKGVRPVAAELYKNALGTVRGGSTYKAASREFITCCIECGKTDMARAHILSVLSYPGLMSDDRRWYEMILRTIGA